MSREGFESSGSCLGIFGVIFLIPFGILAILALGYAGILQFKVGLHTLITIAVIFVIFIFFIKHNASYAACKISNNFPIMEDRLQEALKANALTILGKAKSTLTVRDFLDDYFRGVRDDNFAKVASSVFPMLGILGTFIAIALSMPDFTVSSSEKLDQEISILLSGIGTAFYASIYGIFLSLWWIFFERRGLARIENNTLNLEKLYSGHIWKKSELTKHEHMQTELKDQKVIETLKDTFNLDFLKDLNSQYMRNFKTIIDDTTNSFERIATHMESVSRDLRKTIDEMNSHQESVEAIKTLKQDIGQFMDGVERLSSGLENFNGSVDHTFEKIDQELAKSVDKLAEFGDTIVEYNRRVEDRFAKGTKE